MHTLINDIIAEIADTLAKIEGHGAAAAVLTAAERRCSGRDDKVYLSCLLTELGNVCNPEVGDIAPAYWAAVDLLDTI